MVIKWNSPIEMYGVAPCSNRDVWCSTRVAIEMYGVALCSNRDVWCSTRVAMGSSI